ncbi:unnamed protein product [Kuraishia capsulata CBS 1993]|uniref:EamA domain-containing protein n=1 Tax=Kuraishia capsulata CBS 1993 TaxID=1382522 RepID=W6MGB0_9ASCO|nr:uncharacterized protein KUCA_T00000461001 [Kuraishia capsulata CBS 1993]CDK24498.1 unnamed protein product [Kuraishia capsulata CBS 1993]
MANNPGSSGTFVAMRSPIILIDTAGGGTINTPKSFKAQSPTLEISETEYASQVVELIKDVEEKRWRYGLFLLGIVVVFWIASTQLINSVTKTGEYEQPFFVSYITGGSFVIYAIPDAIDFVRRRIFRESGSDEVKSPTLDEETPLIDSAFSETVIQTPDIKLTQGEIILLALETATIYFIGNACGSAALKFTSATNQTILMTATSLFTLVLGVAFKVESFSWPKLVSIIVSITGIFLITLSDSHSKHNDALKNPILGDFIALCGSFAYACYLIIMKVKMGDSTDPQNDRIVFAWVGVFTLVLFWPVMLILHITNVQPFYWPGSGTVWFIVLASGVLNCISDYCSVMASLLTSPLLAALSLSTAIPLSMICDSIFYHTTNTSLIYYLGIFFIFSAFLITNKEDNETVIDEAVGDAIEEAIANDELLSPILSPLLGSSGSENYIPGLSIDSDTGSSQIVISGGVNHKYFIREVRHV